MWHEQEQQFTQKYLAPYGVAPNGKPVEQASTETAVAYLNIAQEVMDPLGLFGPLGMLLEMAQSTSTREHTAMALAAMAGVISASPHLKRCPLIEQLIKHPMFPAAHKEIQKRTSARPKRTMRWG
jgi:hypothetical protein